MVRPSQQTSYEEVAKFLGPWVLEFEKMCQDQNKKTVRQFIDDWTAVERKPITLWDVLYGTFDWNKYGVGEAMTAYVQRLEASLPDEHRVG